jgi:hypothetical protein
LTPIEALAGRMTSPRVVDAAASGLLRGPAPERRAAVERAAEAYAAQLAA